MFIENQPVSCIAQQVSDQMRCERCNLLWDINDIDPPKCKTGHDLFEQKRDELKRVNNK